MDFVTQGSAHMEWSFRSEGHDIAFGLIHESIGEIIPLKRVPSHKSLEEGSHKCEIPGKYTLVFDNSHSYTRSKKLIYKIEIVPDSSADEEPSTNKYIVSISENSMGKKLRF
jgi:hypothetical protein